MVASEGIFAALVTIFVVIIALTGILVRLLVPKRSHSPWGRILWNRKAAGALVVVAGSMFAVSALVGLSVGRGGEGYVMSLSWTAKLAAPPLAAFIGG